MARLLRPVERPTYRLWVALICRLIFASAPRLAVYRMFSQPLVAINHAIGEDEPFEQGKTQAGHAAVRAAALKFQTLFPPIGFSFAVMLQRSAVTASESNLLDHARFVPVPAFQAICEGDIMDSETNWLHMSRCAFKALRPKIQKAPLVMALRSDGELMSQPRNLGRIFRPSNILIIDWL